MINFFKYMYKNYPIGFLLANVFLFCNIICLFIVKIDTYVLASIICFLLWYFINYIEYKGWLK